MYVNFKFLLAFVFIVLLLPSCREGIGLRNTKACCELDPITENIDGVGIFVPNIFTPNRDGINDVLMVFSGLTAPSIKNFAVRNKRGNIVFEISDVQTNDPAFGWDGETDGEIVIGLYDVFLEIISINGESQILEGEVCLLTCEDGVNDFDAKDNCIFSSQHNGLGGFDVEFSSFEDCIN